MCPGGDALDLHVVITVWMLFKRLVYGGSQSCCGEIIPPGKTDTKSVLNFLLSRFF